MSAIDLPPVERGSRDERDRVPLYSTCQSPLLGFGWVGDSLPNRRVSDMVTRPSWKLTTTVREILGFRVDTTRPAETAPCSLRSRQSSALSWCCDGRLQRVGRGPRESFCITTTIPFPAPTAQPPTQPPPRKNPQSSHPNFHFHEFMTDQPTRRRQRRSNDGLGFRL